MPHSLVRQEVEARITATSLRTPSTSGTSPSSQIHRSGTSRMPPATNIDTHTSTATPANWPTQISHGRGRPSAREDA